MAAAPLWRGWGPQISQEGYKSEKSNKNMVRGSAAGGHFRYLSECGLDSFLGALCEIDSCKLWSAFRARDHAQRRPKRSQKEPERDVRTTWCNVLKAWYLLHRKHIEAFHHGPARRFFRRPHAEVLPEGVRRQVFDDFSVFRCACGFCSGSLFATFFDRKINAFFRFGDGMRFRGCATP